MSLPHGHWLRLISGGDCIWWSPCEGGTHESRVQLLADYFQAETIVPPPETVELPARGDLHEGGVAPKPTRATPLADAGRGGAAGGFHGGSDSGGFLSGTCGAAGAANRVRRNGVEAGAETHFARSP